MQDWINVGFKSLVFAVFSLFTFFVSQLNSSITGLTSEIRIMEAHQTDSDKRILAIEVSRDSNGPAYQKLLGDVSDLKTSMIEVRMRQQTISDFVVKNLRVAAGK